MEPLAVPWSMMTSMVVVPFDDFYSALTKWIHSAKSVGQGP